ncbi:nuclear transport factor 2 family protein [Microtetraspora niveoalba]|uniref:nuclear transport factor 2 family protein n=1 Tax=Microtetraspora niveoalba TaxID=46175 RepID=UPI00082D6138|nr:nuclear transport factor 2 family protein [Microtetraspora niveoalba]
MTLGTGDRVELADLVSRYALYTDRRDLDGLARLFTEDGVLVLPDAPRELGPVRAHTGRAEIRGTMAKLAAFPVTFHALTGHVFDAGPDPRTATGSVACVAHHLSERPSGEVSDLVWHLRYTDSYLRDDEAGWRFRRRELGIEWIETRPVRRWRGDAERGGER